MTARRIRLTRAEALRDDRSEMVLDHLVECPVSVREVRGGEVDHQLGLGCDLMDDLEVEHRLALRFRRGSPARVALDAEHRIEWRKAELGSELVEVIEIRQVIDLREHDRLAASIKPGVA